MKINKTDEKWIKACISLAYQKKGVKLIRKDINHLKLINMVLKRENKV